MILDIDTFRSTIKAKIAEGCTANEMKAMLGVAAMTTPSPLTAGQLAVWLSEAYDLVDRVYAAEVN